MRTDDGSACLLRAAGFAPAFSRSNPEDGVNDARGSRGFSQFHDVIHAHRVTDARGPRPQSKELRGKQLRDLIHTNGGDEDGASVHYASPEYCGMHAVYIAGGRRIPHGRDGHRLARMRVILTAALDLCNGHERWAAPTHTHDPIFMMFYCFCQLCV